MAAPSAFSRISRVRPWSGQLIPSAADKAARFVELCDAYGFPLVAFIDNPGFMVGLQSEAEGMARHHARPLAACTIARCRYVRWQVRKGVWSWPLCHVWMGHEPKLRRC